LAFIYLEVWCSLKKTAIKTKLTSSSASAAAANFRHKVIILFLIYLTEISSLGKCSISKLHNCIKSYKNCILIFEIFNEN